MRTTADKVRILAEINRLKLRQQGAEPDRLESVGDNHDTATASKNSKDKIYIAPAISYPHEELDSCNYY
jgi:hypothetical protein